MTPNKINSIPRKVILWGGTGQAKVVRPIIEYCGSKIIAVFDDTPELKSPFTDIKIYCGWNEFQKWINRHKRKEIGFCIAIGNPHGRIRLEFHERLLHEGLTPITIAHPTAWIAENAVIGEGTQIMAGAIIQPEVRIGRQCIINTKASVDHECYIEDGVEVTPGVTLCGSVHLETNCWICAGSTILPRVRIGHDAIVGAGSLVTQNAPNNALVAGVPARLVRLLEKK
jgi:sugar O-acyltransferase (sialic acid O-acetyltransferase NeuD family)